MPPAFGAEDWSCDSRELAFSDVLHTWNQELFHHRWVRCVVPVGSLDRDHSSPIYARRACSSCPVNFVIPIADPTYTGIDVQVEVTALPGSDKVALQSAIVASLQDFLDPSRWGVPMADLTEWVNDTKVRYLEVANIVNNVRGVNYIVNMTTAIHNGSPNVTDIQMPGDVALPTAGSIVVTVD